MSDQFVTHEQLKDELHPIQRDLAVLSERVERLGQRMDEMNHTMRFLVGVLVIPVAIPMLAVAYKLVVG